MFEKQTWRFKSEEDKNRFLRGESAEFEVVRKDIGNDIEQPFDFHQQELPSEEWLKARKLVLVSEELWDQLKKENSELKAEKERLNGELLDQIDRRHWLANEIERLNAENEELKFLLKRWQEAARGE